MTRRVRQFLAGLLFLACAPFVPASASASTATGSFEVPAITGRPVALEAYLRRGFTLEQALRLRQLDELVAGGVPRSALPYRVTGRRAPAKRGTTCFVILFSFEYVGGLQAAGDLNGDSRLDVLENRQVKLTSSTHAWVVTARDGRTGRPLWVHREVQDKHHSGLVLAMRTGSSGADGVLLVDEQFVLDDEAVRGSYTVKDTLTGLDGRGRRLWSAGAAGSGMYDLIGLSGSARHVPYQVIPTRLHSGADSVLVGSTSYETGTGTVAALLGGAQPSSAYTAVVLSGSDGRTAARVPTATTSSTSRAGGGVLPDQDGDGYGDLWTASPGALGTLSAYRGSTGKALWSTTMYLNQFVQIQDAGRLVDGESRARDLAVSTQSPLRTGSVGVGGLSLVANQDVLVTLLAGGTGRLEWTRPGTSAYPVQVTGSPLRPTLGVATVTVRTPPTEVPTLAGTVDVAVDVALYDVNGLPISTQRYTYSRATTGCGDGAALPLTTTGDVDADGYGDSEIVLAIVDERALTVQVQVIRTGDGAVLSRADDEPLGGTLDGHGDDRVALTATTASVTTTAERGDGARPMWRHSTAIPGTLNDVQVYAVAASSTTCDDVYVGVFGDQGTSIELLSSAGRLRWSLAYRTGLEPGDLEPQTTAKGLC